jgi:hypothetical protein
MFDTEQDESTYRVRYRSFVIAAIMLLIPPALVYEHAGSLLDASIGSGELAGLVIGILLPLLGAYYFAEFSSFTFSTDDNRFQWRWRNLIRKKSGEEPLNRIVQVRREALESSGSAGLQYSYRLVVILDDDRIIPLTRGFSSVHGKRLDLIAEQIRDHLELQAAMP